MGASEFTFGERLLLRRVRCDPTSTDDSRFWKELLRTFDIQRLGFS